MFSEWSLNIFEVGVVVLRGCFEERDVGWIRVGFLVDEFWFLF